MLVESISININRRKYAHNNLSFKATDHSELLKLPDRTIFNQIRNGNIQLSQKDYDGNTILHILIKEILVASVALLIMPKRLEYAFDDIFEHSINFSLQKYPFDCKLII